LPLKREIALRAIVAGMVLALAGLIGIQWHLLRQAMALKEQAFRRNVSAALNTVAQKMEAGEAYRDVIGMALAVPPPGAKSHFSMEEVLTSHDSLPEHSGPRLARKGRTVVTVTTSSSGPGSQAMMSGLVALPLRSEGNRILYTVLSPQHVRLQLYDLASGRDTVIVDTFKTPGVYEVRADRRVPQGGGDFFYRYTADSSQFYLRLGGAQDRASVSVSGGGKRELVNRVVDRLIVAEQQPIERRLKPTVLDSLLTSSLRDAGIPLPFNRAVYSRQDSALTLLSPGAAQGELRSSDLRARLFPTDLLSPRNDLVVYFPGQQSFLFSQIVPQLGAAALFTLIIVLSFIYAVRTIMAQTRLARLMIDFINNMTHEFKTPISTVSLAVEAIGRPDVIGQPDRVLRYNNVIRDENARMRLQVERILQMAVLERGEYEMNLLPVDVHDLIRRASAGVALQAEHRGGRLELFLDARDHLIRADAVHLTNILNNLLDNANKYSPESPRIAVSTRNADGRLMITVKDNGIGIAEGHLPRVFDKFYRVPTGNRHDVKGFGLGLSYVKLMTEAMGGTVTITSVMGRGTSVGVGFPVV
jgi:two-component system phosphate regulon sensor histidine kinase PhoR